MIYKNDLNTNEFDAYFGNYIEKVADSCSLRDGFAKGRETVLSFFAAIPKEKLDYRYAPGKWSIKETFQHIIDTERVLMYRCFRIARNDKTSLASFDQDVFVAPSNAANKTIESLLDEYKATRNHSISFINSLRAEDLQQIGISSNSNLSARAAAFIVLGHEIWHVAIIKERYL